MCSTCGLGLRSVEASSLGARRKAARLIICCCSSPLIWWTHCSNISKVIRPSSEPSFQQVSILSPRSFTRNDTCSWVSTPVLLMSPSSQIMRSSDSGMRSRCQTHRGPDDCSRSTRSLRVKLKGSLSQSIPERRRLGVISPWLTLRGLISDSPATLDLLEALMGDEARTEVRVEVRTEARTEARSCWCRAWRLRCRVRHSGIATSVAVTRTSLASEGRNTGLKEWWRRNVSGAGVHSIRYAWPLTHRDWSSATACASSSV
mmetsp:Transcript_142189/g.247868  ORF Transcript_142189/g.247868 Transcript_142189/m.247868 type:complete len:260 (-) Transcript_142189:367-1146(-)